MNVSELISGQSGWTRFNLNVGGFSIRNCRWRASTGQVVFPRRYDSYGRQYRVIFAYGRRVRRLQELLESGQMATPRDRRPCILKIRALHGIEWEPGWYVFNFTVRGFTILGCRWKPETGSIQLPVTFIFDTVRIQRVKKQVICAYGAHVNRLRHALEAHAPELVGATLVEVQEVIH